MRVRGTELTPSVRLTIVHELTHALQDQKVHLDSVERAIERDGGDSTAWHGLLEGDASHVENAYFDNELSVAEQAAMRDEQDHVDTAGYDQAPVFLQDSFEARYSLGYEMAQVVLRRGGAGRLYDLMRDPPRSTLALMQPDLVLSGLPRVAPPDRPALADGEAKVDGFPDRLGPLWWYLVATERGADPRAALTTLAAWRDDRATTVRRGSTICVRATILTTSSAAAADVRGLIDSLYTGGPAATTGVSAEVVTYDRCDPGPANATLPDVAVPVLSFPATRNAIVDNVLARQPDLTPARAACTADRVLHGLTPAQITGDEPPPDDTVIDSLIEFNLQAC
jgi:hypothetical protein